MNRTKLTYRYLLLFFLAFSLLGAISYAPYTKKQQSAQKEDQKQHTDSHPELTVSQHVSSSSLAIPFDVKFTDIIFHAVSFRLPFQVKHKIAPVLFSISYRDNLFPFSIAAQAP